MRTWFILFFLACLSLGAQPAGVWRLTGTRHWVDPFTRCAKDKKTGDEGDVVVHLWSECAGQPFPTLKVRAQWQAPPNTLVPGQVFPWEHTLTPLACSGGYGGQAHLSASVLEYGDMGPTDAGCAHPLGAGRTFRNQSQARPLKVPAPVRQWAKTFILRVKVAANSDFMWDYTYTFEAGATPGAAAPVAGASTATLASLPDVWTVNEVQVWTGTWVRRPGTNLYDATWRHRDGQVAKDVLEFESLQGDRLTILRRSLNGRYTATVSPDRKRLLNGTATWYERGWAWSASATR